MPESLQIRVHGDASLPTLVYLPGVHGDWTLIGSFRAAVAGKLRFVEFTYPRTETLSLEDYADAIIAQLHERGISRGWILAESFGSQIAWPMLDPMRENFFRADGLILAGGFVRHPMHSGVLGSRWFCATIPMILLKAFLKLYRLYAQFRFRNAPETLSDVNEFIARRTELDRRAGVHRLCLISRYDPAPIARKTLLPVYQLSGGIDPIVPWPAVRAWLQRSCPGYRDSRIITFADHNVLGSAAHTAADQVLAWMQESEATSLTVSQNPLQ